ncbi:MAG: hypothetical protein JNK00_08460 [Flavipsychrobacter sp.]|nr:hypothetical protein [Flavipsychrobacter sp.]
MSILTLGCKKVDSNDLKDTVPYYQSYGVYFDKDAGTIEASAVFRVRDVNGTKVELSNGAGVTANGVAASTNFILPSDYFWNMIGLKDVEFVLTKNSGNVLTNRAKLSDISNISFANTFPASASKSGFSFGWVGDPLTGNETMVVTISTIDSAGTASKALDASNSATTVSFSATDMQYMKAGNNLTVEMTRYKSIPLQMADGTATGSIALRYRTTKTIPLNP